VYHVAKVGAIIEAFFPGQYAAEALMRLILGQASFSGLMPVTVYDADFIQRRNITNLDLRGEGGVTYRYFDGTPLWPFGFGLSYTEFTFKGNSTATIHTTVATAARQPLCFGVRMENIGQGERAHTSDVVVLGFIGSDHLDAPRNPKLCDFVREAAVKVGERREVGLCVESLGSALALVDEKGVKHILPGEYTVTAGVQGGVGGAGAGSVVGTVVIAA
jgi:hypothetical protein